VRIQRVWEGGEKKGMSELMRESGRLRFAENDLELAFGPAVGCFAGLIHCACGREEVVVRRGRERKRGRRENALSQSSASRMETRVLSSLYLWVAIDVSIDRR
jgi:hypothetical protein